MWDGWTLNAHVVRISVIMRRPGGTWLRSLTAPSQVPHRPHRALTAPSQRPHSALTETTQRRHRDDTAPSQRRHRDDTETTQRPHGHPAETAQGSVPHPPRNRQIRTQMCQFWGVKDPTETPPRIRPLVGED